MTITSLLQKSKINLGFPPILSEDGQRMEKSAVSDQTGQEEFIIPETSRRSLGSRKNLKQEKLSCTQESPPCTKKKISRGRSSISKPSTQNVKSTKTLVLGSIGKDKDLIPFWKPCTKEISGQLWSPIKTDCVVLDSNSWNGSSKKLMSNSWFSVQIQNKKTPLENSQKTFLQSLQSLLPEIMGLEQGNTEEKEEIITSKEKAAKSMKIRIYPTMTQKVTLSKWLGLQRWVYNQCLSYLNEYKKTSGTIPSIKKFREEVINDKNFINKNQWVKEYNYDLRDESLRDFLKNLKSNMAKSKNSGKGFTLKYKSKKGQDQHGTSLSVLSKYWNNQNSFYTCIFSSKYMKSSEPLPDKLAYTCRLTKTSTKKYFLTIPRPIHVKDDTQVLQESMIFLDPGSCDFVTGYDPEGKTFVCGQRDIGRIARLLHYQRKLISKTKKSNIPSNKKSKFRSAILRMGEKIRNLVTDLHRKLAKWLCENYKYIFLPRLNFHACKNLYRKEKAKLASLRHCEFLNLLQDKSREYPGCKVLEVNESYTSKTCSECGHENTYNKSERMVTCTGCKKTNGRDINASKNIMLRFFTMRAKLSYKDSRVEA